MSFLVLKYSLRLRRNIYIMQQVYQMWFLVIRFRNGSIVAVSFLNILLFHFVFLFSCGKLPEKTFAFSDNLRIDSLEHMAMDSIYRNPRYAHSALDEALSLTKDSDK